MKKDWITHCLGSEGWQVRYNNDGLSASDIKKDRKRMYPVATLHGEFKEQEANAKLMADSPQMLEFCQDLYLAIRNGFERIGSGRSEKLEEILAKIEGDKQKG